MSDYRTGGTPWTVIIGSSPDRKVMFNGFQIEVTDAISIVEQAVSQATLADGLVRPRT